MRHEDDAEEHHREHFGSSNTAITNNGTFAVYQKINELADRYDVPPCSFVATLRITDAGTMVLAYEAPPQDSVVQGRFFAMLDNLGIAPDESTMRGTDEVLYDALQAAIRRAPMRRGRV